MTHQMRAARRALGGPRSSPRGGPTRTIWRASLGVGAVALTLTCGLTPSQAAPSPSTEAGSSSASGPIDAEPATTADLQAATTPSGCTVSAKLVPSCGLLWGAAPAAFDPGDRLASVNAYETAQGRPINVYHGYHTDGQVFPNSAERQIASDPSKPRLLLLNWRPATDMTWAQVAEGRADARIDAAASNFKTFPHAFFLAVWHEPEHYVDQTAGSGMTASDYRNMVRHVILRLKAQGVQNAVTVQINQGYPYYAAMSWWPTMYPGDDVIDWLSVDSYNSGYSSGYNTGDFGDMVNRTKGSWDGWYNWATKNHPGKPLMLSEWGVWYQPTDPGRQASFYDQVRQQLPQYPAIKGMMYFNSKNAPKGSDAINQTPTGLTAFQQLTSSIPRVDVSGH